MVKRTCSSCRGSEFSSWYQHLCQAVYDHLEHQLSGSQQPLLNSVDPCTPVHLPILRYTYNSKVIKNIPLKRSASVPQSQIASTLLLHSSAGALVLASSVCVQRLSRNCLLLTMADLIMEDKRTGENRYFRPTKKPNSIRGSRFRLYLPDPNLYLIVLLTLEFLVSSDDAYTAMKPIKK